MRFKTFSKLSCVLRIKRPLRFYTREKIVQFVFTFFLPVWFDPSNSSNHLTRGRIRFNLMPFLQRFFCPSLSRRLLILSNKCCEEGEQSINLDKGYPRYLQDICSRHFFASILELKNTHSIDGPYPQVQLPRRSLCNALAKFLKYLNVQTNFSDLRKICFTLLKIVK